MGQGTSSKTECSSCHWSCHTCDGGGPGDCSSCVSGRHLYDGWTGNYCYECTADSHCTDGFTCRTSLGKEYYCIESGPTQVYTVGESVTVRWSPATFSGQVTLTLYEQDVVGDDDICGLIASGVENTGEYSWTLPDDFWLRDCVSNAGSWASLDEMVFYALVSGTDGSESQERQLKSFKVLEPSLTLTNPTESSYVTPGDTVSIAWEYSGAPADTTVTIQLYERDPFFGIFDDLCMTITTEVALSSLQYSWEVPPDLLEYPCTQSIVSNTTDTELYIHIDCNDALCEGSSDIFNLIFPLADTWRHNDGLGFVQLAQNLSFGIYDDGIEASASNCGASDGMWATLLDVSYGVDSGEADRVALVASKRMQTIVMVFEGSGDSADLANNLNIIPSPCAGVLFSDAPDCGLVHEGFGQEYNTVAFEVIGEAQSLIQAWSAELGDEMHLTIICTGHSLGGAIATLAAKEMDNWLTVHEVGLDSQVKAIQLITFGSPRVGNSAFVASFSNRVVPQRVVTSCAQDPDCLDLVSVQPALYEHLGGNDPLDAVVVTDFTCSSCILGIGLHRKEAYQEVLRYPDVFDKGICHPQQSISLVNPSMFATVYAGGPYDIVWEADNVYRQLQMSLWKHNTAGFDTFCFPIGVVDSRAGVYTWSVPSNLQTWPCISAPGDRDSLYMYMESESGHERLSSPILSVVDDYPPSTTTWMAQWWTTCSASCGGGSQSRTVECISPGGTVVSDEACSAPKPPTVQSCNTAACEAFSWAWAQWGPCSASCGGGAQSRTVECMSSTGAIVSDTFCSESKPLSTQSCNTDACTGDQFSGQEDSAEEASSGDRLSACFFFACLSGLIWQFWLLV
eukprot:scaffold3032_cov375-Prasinococcus_capsulatus_cf.AAC.11